MSLTSPTSPRPALSRSRTATPQLTTKAPPLHRGTSYDTSKQATAILSRFSGLHSPIPRQEGGVRSTSKTDYFALQAPDAQSKGSTEAAAKSEAAGVKASSYFSFPNFDDLQHPHSQGRPQDDARVEESCRG